MFSSSFPSTRLIHRLSSVIVTSRFPVIQRQFNRFSAQSNLLSFSTSSKVNTSKSTKMSAIETVCYMWFLYN